MEFRVYPTRNFGYKAWVLYGSKQAICTSNVFLWGKYQASLSFNLKVWIQNPGFTRFHNTDIFLTSVRQSNFSTWKLRYKTRVSSVSTKLICTNAYERQSNFLVEEMSGYSIRKFENKILVLFVSIKQICTEIYESKVIFRGGKCPFFRPENADTKSGVHPVLQNWCVQKLTKGIVIFSWLNIRLPGHSIRKFAYKIWVLYDSTKRICTKDYEMQSHFFVGKIPCYPVIRPENAVT